MIKKLLGQSQWVALFIFIVLALIFLYMLFGKQSTFIVGEDLLKGRPPCAEIDNRNRQEAGRFEIYYYRQGCARTSDDNSIAALQLLPAYETRLHEMGLPLIKQPISVLLLPQTTTRILGAPGSKKALIVGVGKQLDAYQIGYGLSLAMLEDAAVFLPERQAQAIAEGLAVVTYPDTLSGAWNNSTSDKNNFYSRLIKNGHWKNLAKAINDCRHPCQWPY